MYFKGFATNRKSRKSSKKPLDAKTEFTQEVFNPVFASRCNFIFSCRSAILGKSCYINWINQIR